MCFVSSAQDKFWFQWLLCVAVALIWLVTLFIDLISTNLVWILSRNQPRTDEELISAVDIFSQKMNASHQRDPSIATLKKEVWRSIWWHSMRVSWSDYELFSLSGNCGSTNAFECIWGNGARFWCVQQKLPSTLPQDQGMWTYTIKKISQLD